MTNPHGMAEERNKLVPVIPAVKVTNISRYESIRKRVFYFMERPNSNVSMVYHLMNLMLILGSIILSVLSTIQTFEKNPVLIGLILYYELALLTWFAIEYVLRVWSCSFLPKYKGIMGVFRFMKSLYMLIDAFVILSTLITAILHIKTAYFSILRITRFLQIFRILRLDRQRGDLRTMGKVVYKHRKELVTCYFVGFIILFGGTYIVYVVEKFSEEEGTIDNMANGLYWAMITVTSVGYGDISPKTWPGKLITGVFALVGCSFFALPSGILGSGFALQVAKQKKQKRYIKVRNPAALVIQTCWRNYAVKDNKYQLQATWHFFFPQSNSFKRPEYYDILPGIREILHSDCFCGYKEGVLIDTRKVEELTPIKARKNGVTIALKDLSRRESAIDLITGLSKRDRKRSSSSMRKKSSNDKPLSVLLSSRYKTVIKFIIRVKFWISVKNFKSVRYPFVNVQDIMEKNSLSHIETLSHLKDIHNCLNEFRSEIEDMRLEIKNLTTQRKITQQNSFTSQPTSESIDSMDKVIDIKSDHLEKAQSMLLI